MPALNRSMYVPVAAAPQVMFANLYNVDGDIASNVRVASRTPVGTNIPNSVANWFENVLDAEKFAFLVPYGTQISRIFTLNDMTDTWEEMNWQEAPKSGSYSDMKYSISTSILDGYTAYIFIDRDLDGEPVRRSFPIGILVEPINE